MTETEAALVSAMSDVIVGMGNWRRSVSGHPPMTTVEIWEIEILLSRIYSAGVQEMPEIDFLENFPSQQGRAM